MYLANNVNYPRRWYYYELHLLGECEVETTMMDLLEYFVICIFNCIIVLSA